MNLERHIFATKSGLKMTNFHKPSKWAQLMPFETKLVKQLSIGSQKKL